ncbi:hypothetical protein BDD12DRAFT_894904 [Trichophaea hybrida]|nr:hypothetical protein BDD12DRAFT_894904 [Trichophaea hybrida]
MHSPPSSPPSSPPQPHTGNDNRHSNDNRDSDENRDSDKNIYYIYVHNGSHTPMELPPPHQWTRYYRTLGNTDKAETHPETEQKSALGCQRLSPMMTPTTMHGCLMRKAKYIQADHSDSSCDAEDGAIAAANLQRKPKGKRSGSNDHCKRAWAVVRENFENGLINVTGNTEQIATVSRLTNLTVAEVKHKRYRKDYPWHLEKAEISGGIAMQIRDLKEQLPECKLNGKPTGAGALKHDLKELSKQLIHDLNAQLHECELNGTQAGARAGKYNLKELSKQLVLSLLSIRFCQVTVESTIFLEWVLKLAL